MWPYKQRSHHSLKKWEGYPQGDLMWPSLTFEVILHLIKDCVFILDFYENWFIDECAKNNSLIRNLRVYYLCCEMQRTYILKNLIVKVGIHFIIKIWFDFVDFLLNYLGVVHYLFLFFSKKQFIGNLPGN